MRKNSDSFSDKSSTPSAIMTIDVEDWFHVENLKSVISRSMWDSCESRVVGNTSRMLELLEKEGISATFFVLGWVAERNPDLIRRISDAGHEIAAHGYNHQLISNLAPDEFKRDVLKCKQILEDLTGQPVTGYRAPSFSITDWAIDCLVQLGFSYDSSAFPFVQHGRYGQLAGVSPNVIVEEIRPGFSEVCIPCLPTRFVNLPWGGGGYFRLCPYRLFRWGVKNILGKRNAYVFYIHPWEIDPEQPRIKGVKMSEGFRHYLNLKHCERRWLSLLKDFDWLSISNFLQRR